MKKITLLFLALGFTAVMSSQCLTATNGQYPAATAANVPYATQLCDGTTVNSITTLGYGSEYSTVSVITGQTYTFSSSIATDVVTISADAGATSAAFGIGSVTWVSTVTGVINFYTNLNDGACGSSTAFRTRSFVCGTPPTCAGPTAVTATGITSTGATITWTAAPTSPANGYDYYFSTSNTAPGSTTTPTGNVSATTTTIPLTGLTPSTPYYYWVRSNCSLTDQGIWIYGTFTTPAVPPTNDDCSGAIVVTCGSATTGTTAAATNENAAVCGISGVTTQNTAGVWYKFTGDGSDVTVTTCSSTITSGDSRIAVFSGSCGALTCVGGNDDAGAAGCSTNSLASTVAFTSVAGTDYYILVYAYSSNSLNFELNISCASACTPATANDECATATTLTVGTTLTGTNNLCSSASLGVTYPSCGSTFNTYYDTWYSFDTGSSTDFTVTLANPTGTTGFAVYSGTCGALTMVVGSCNTGAATATLTGLTTATTYYIRAFSTTTANRGTFDLTVLGTLATTSFDTGNFTYYPNPVKNTLTLSYTKEINTVEVFNLLGQKVMAVKTNTTQPQIDMTTLSSGAYIVKVTSNGETKTLKVIKD